MTKESKGQGQRMEFRIKSLKAEFFLCRVTSTPHSMKELPEVISKALSCFGGFEGFVFCFYIYSSYGSSGGFCAYAMGTFAKKRLEFFSGQPIIPNPVSCSFLK